MAVRFYAVFRSSVRLPVYVGSELNLLAGQDMAPFRRMERVAAGKKKPAYGRA